MLVAATGVLLLGTAAPGWGLRCSTEVSIIDDTCGAVDADAEPTSEPVPSATAEAKSSPEPSEASSPKATATEAPEGQKEKDESESAGGARSGTDGDSSGGGDPADESAARNAEKLAGAGPAQSVAVAAERVTELAAPLAIPMSLAMIAFLLLGAAARGPGRLTKLEEYGDGGVYRL